MRYLLDTNAVSDAVARPNGGVAGSIRRIAEAAPIVTSIIVVSELRYGYTKISSIRLRQAYEMFFETIDVERWEQPFDHVYAELRSALEKRGRAMSAMDLLVAAHALATDATLVTNDRAFVHVPGLKVENWLRDAPADRE